MATRPLLKFKLDLQRFHPSRILLLKHALPRPSRADLVLWLGSVSLVAASLFVFAGPGLQQVQRASLETAIRTNAATLQLAAESYAAAHQGQYPADPHDLLPWLPGDCPPSNPLSGDPVRFLPQPGDVTYRSPTGGRDYVIEGWGRRAAMVPPVIVLVGYTSIDLQAAISN